MGVVTYSCIGGEVISETRDGVERDYLPDPLGSTVALLDSNQNKTDAFSYWPYGEDRASTGSTPVPYRFVGTLGYRRETSTRSYVRARHYRSDQARWMKRDLLWPGESPFGYVRGRPATWVDANGNRPEKHRKKAPKKLPSPCDPAEVTRIYLDLTGSGDPWRNGQIRRCIGQYLPDAPECGRHGGGHGFSGLLGAGCGIQLQIDLCVVFSPIAGPDGGPPFPNRKQSRARIPACLDQLLKEKNFGENPLSHCVSVDEPRRYGDCPPGYTWVSAPPFSIGLPSGCRESEIRLPDF